MIIDGQPVNVPGGTTILEAADSVNIYIPRLCHHPDLPPAQYGQSSPVVFDGNHKIENAMPGEPGPACGLCVVAVAGVPELVEACAAEAADKMVVVTDNADVQTARRERLMSILAGHRHACLTCAQQEGCSRSRCSANIDENQRCCPRFGHCELQDVADFIGIPAATPRWIPTALTAIEKHPLFVRDPSLCIGCTRCVRACRDLRGIEAIGFVYDENRRVHIGSLAESLESAGCKFCTACVAVCPTGALMDRIEAPPAASREERLVPCTSVCPVHIDIPGYLRMIAGGRVKEAYAVIREKVPFPGILGRICTHPCEPVCRRGAVNDPIAICALKRYAADRGASLGKTSRRIAAETGKKVAVIGAGPAGLTAACYLRKLGHRVSLFDSNSEAGGLLRYGIPRYRLPIEVVEREVREILDLGIDFIPDRTLAREFTLDQIKPDPNKSDGFDAVFLAMGAAKTRRIALAEGCRGLDVLEGVEFLRRVAEGREVVVKDKVAVIGGGNAAVDAALSAKRCGAAEVTIVCLEGLTEMPAGDREIKTAEAEGVRILAGLSPARITRKGGKVTGLDVLECNAVFDEQGNFCPQFGEVKECLAVDQVIVAAGQTADLSFLEENSSIQVTRGRVIVAEDTLATAMTGVYAGGDLTAASGAVIDAIAAGRRAAISIDRALGGSGNIDDVFFPRDDTDPLLGRNTEFASQSRHPVPELDVKTRTEGFQEINLGYTDETAVKEAGRCLQCDLRLKIRSNPVPAANRWPLDDLHISEVPATEGVLQLLDSGHRVLAIKGTANLRRELTISLENIPTAAFFEYAEEKLFSKRESELIQKYIQQHGKMPGGGFAELDDLF